MIYTPSNKKAYNSLLNNIAMNIIMIGKEKKNKTTNIMPL